jgi:hypothetical protein
MKKYKYSKCECGATFLGSAIYVKEGNNISARCRKCKKDITKRLEEKINEEI